MTTEARPSVRPLLDFATELAEATVPMGLIYQSRAEVEEEAGELPKPVTRAEVDEAWSWLMDGKPLEELRELNASGRGPGLFFVEEVRDNGEGGSLYRIEELADLDDATRQRLLASALVHIAHLRSELMGAVAEFGAVFAAIGAASAKKLREQDGPPA